jgi:hypothetical protein
MLRLCSGTGCALDDLVDLPIIADGEAERAFRCGSLGERRHR